MKTVIIFGASGQDGYYMQKLLRDLGGFEVHALSHADCNVATQGYVAAKIATHKPDYIFHFAAKSSASHEVIRDNQRAIVDGTLYILEAVREYCPGCKVFLSGSILQFKNDPEGVDLSSTKSYNSAYAAQRWASVAMARYYRTLGLQVYVGYFSHHDSPRRGDNHLAKRLANDVKALAAGQIDHLVVRDPDDRKEWNFAGDMMEAVWAQVNSPIYEAVLGSGIAHSVGEYSYACTQWVPGHHRFVVCAEFTKVEPTVSVTADSRFAHHFKTNLTGLAKLMVGG